MNLVQNPSFEDTVQCPINNSQIDRAQGWWSASDSPDYFNNCSINPNFSTPYNWGGYQPPGTGVAYSALGTYAPCCPNIREIIMSQLTTTLTVGTKYYVSFKACLSIDPSIQALIATNKLGAKFSKNTFTWTSPPPLNNFAHVYTNTIITDSVNWTLVKGSFVADSNYKYVMIGNFFNDANTSSYTFTNTSLNCAYYYIDDVCVSTDSMLCMVTTSINNFTLSKSFAVYPNPASDKLFISSLEGLRISKVNIIDEFGQVVLSRNYLDNKELDLKLPDGFYLIEIITSDKKYFDKIIVRH